MSHQLTPLLKQQDILHFLAIQRWLLHIFLSRNHLWSVLPTEQQEGQDQRHTLSHHTSNLWDKFMVPLSAIFVSKYPIMLIWTFWFTQAPPTKHSLNQWNIILQGSNIYFYVLYHLPTIKKGIIFFSDSFLKSIHNYLPFLLGLTWSHPISQSVLLEKYLEGGGREEGETDLGLICLWYCHTFS